MLVLSIPLPKVRRALQVGLVGSALMASTVQAQPAQGPTRLRLADALQRADLNAYGNRAARAGADAQQASSLSVMRGVFPTVRVDAGFMQTTDPIGAFGTSLRQRSITQQDFDPARLNFPSAITNYSGGVVVEQPLVNVDAWAGRRAALRATEAARAASTWTEVGTRTDVVKAWFGAVVAREKVVTLQGALRAAREHVRQAESMQRNGLVTPSDAMLASVKALEVEAMLLEAEGESSTSRLALATLLGTPEDSSFVLPAELPSSSAVRSAAQDALAVVMTSRADVTAANAALQAADADANRARALYLPRLNSFARYDWNSAARPFGGDNNWTVGVMASWSPFAGASEIAEGRATAARRSAAEAMRAGASARAALEDTQSRRALEVALARLALSEQVVQQAVTAHRIVARRYAGGLAPVVELLDAAAVENQGRLSHTTARYAVVVAVTERYRATGHDPARVAQLDAAHDVANDSPEWN